MKKLPPAHRLIFCLFFFVGFVSSAIGQTDTVTKHPKMNLKYMHTSKYKDGVLYKDSTVYGYTFGTDTVYPWPYDEAFTDPLVNAYLMKDKKAFKYIKRIRRIDDFYKPVACTLLVLAGIPFFITGYIDGHTYSGNYPVNIVFVAATGGIAIGSICMYALCDHIEKKSLIKAAQRYNRDYGN